MWKDLYAFKRLSLFITDIKIQAGTHDSAEDAYTALKLYNKYRELLRAGDYVIEEELEILYETGRQYNWQVPEWKWVGVCWFDEQFFFKGNHFSIWSV